MLHFFGQTFYSNSLVAKSTKSFILPAQMAFEGDFCYLNSKSLNVNGCYLHLFLIPHSEYVIHSTVTVSAKAYWGIMGSIWILWASWI